jgi:ribokinase
MSKRTMSIGGATYDLFVRLSNETVESCCGDNAFTLALGEKIRTQDVIETCGGGACNTAVGLARLGCQAGFCGVVGDDQWGEKLLENFTKEHVDSACTTIVEGEVSSFSIILSASSGERVILYDPGTNDHLHDVTFDREQVGKVDWVYFNHIQESSCVIEDDMINILAKDGGPRLTWNPGGCQIDVGIEAPNNCTLLTHTDMLQLNKGEALKFSKTETVEDALRILLEKGVKNVCITDGGNGTTASDGVHLYHCPVMAESEIVDTTGAGDAFGTGATWALLEGMSLPEALQAGTINATSVVGKIGAQAGLLTHTEMQQQLQNTKLVVESTPL